MTDDIDFRSSPMESPEGRGIAMSRRHRWKDTIPDEAYEDLAEAHATLEEEGYYEPDVYEDEEGEWHVDQGPSAVEQADLVGFWIAWHRAGGFTALEDSGWHRATIYRKIKVFRTHFGEHPDVYRFDWIKLDLKKLWDEQFYKPVSIAGEIRARRSQVAQAAKKTTARTESPRPNSPKPSAKRTTRRSA